MLIKSITQKALMLLMGCIIAFALVEITLRIYNPFEFRIKGDKIILPSNKEYIFLNDRIDSIDKTIIHKKNSLGFRGKEPPDDFENHLSIISVGGSTTECFYLSEGKTWTDALGTKLHHAFRDLWINNAGFDGHSTFGHIVLMEDHISKLNPKIILFLVGANDNETEKSFNKFDRLSLIEKFKFNSLRSIIKSTTVHSEAMAVALNFYRYFKALKGGISHGQLNLKTIESIKISPDKKESILKQFFSNVNFLTAYESRLEKIVRLSRDNHIEPVFITQPALFGNAIDNITDVDLGKIKVGDLDGDIAWKKLDHINAVTIRVGMRHSVLVIDLANKLSKSSANFYDFLHFTNNGAFEVAEIIYDDLCPYVAKRYPEYLIKDCDDVDGNI